MGEWSTKGESAVAFIVRDVSFSKLWFKVLSYYTIRLVIIYYINHILMFLHSHILSKGHTKQPNFSYTLKQEWVDVSCLFL